MRRAYLSGRFPEPHVPFEGGHRDAEGPDDFLPGDATVHGGEHLQPQFERVPCRGPPWDQGPLRASIAPSDESASYPRSRSGSSVLRQSWRLHGPLFACIGGVVVGVDVTLRHFRLLVLALYRHPLALAPLRGVPREPRRRGMEACPGACRRARAGDARSMRVFFSRLTTPPRRD